MSAHPSPGADEFHPFSQTFRDDPFAFHAQLLRSSPGLIHPEGLPSVYVATYAQCMAVLKDPVRFSSVKPPGTPGMERVDFFNGYPVMNYSDPPQHTRLRRIVNPAFSPKRIKEMTDATVRVIDGLLAPLRAGQEIDAVATITKPFSMQLLLEHFMGVPPEDQHIFMDYLRSVYLLDKLQPGESKPKEFLDAWAKGEQYCREVADRAKREKTESLLGMIVTAQEGGNMSDAEMMAMMVVLFSGGVSTVASAASSTLFHLARNPDVAERIRRDPTLANKHLEEGLRFDPPVTLVMRFSADDQEFEGVRLTKHMPVYAMISVACHDPAEFPEPGRFNPDRANARNHVSFGQGIHTCIGNNITRIAVPMLVQEVARRFPTLRTDPGRNIEWETSPRSRHFKSVPVRL